MSIRELFCAGDDFCQAWTLSMERRRLGRPCGPAPRLCPSEVITLLIHFHQPHYRDFKAYYTQYVARHLRRAYAPSW